MSDLASNTNSKGWLITLAGKAQATATLQAGVDLALAAGAFGQKVTLVFSGEGLALLKPEPDRHEPLHRLLGSLPYYEIDQVYALASHSEALTYRVLEERRHGNRQVIGDQERDVTGAMVASEASIESR